MFTLFKLLAAIIVLAIVSFIIFVSVWLKSDQGRDFKKWLESEKKQNERKED